MREDRVMFRNSGKEMIIFSGVLMACGCFVALAIRLICVNGIYALPMSAGLAFLPLAIYWGMKWGYVLSRLVCGLVVILGVGGSLNPFVYEDVELANGSYVHLLLIALLTAGFAVFLFYCLGEHAKSRGLKSALMRRS